MICPLHKLACSNGAAVARPSSKVKLLLLYNTLFILKNIYLFILKNIYLKLKIIISLLGLHSLNIIGPLDEPLAMAYSAAGPYEL